jgi:hypothetical protein
VLLVFDKLPHVQIRRDYAKPLCACIVLSIVIVRAVNAAIIAGSKSDHPERVEDFWLELAESNPSIIPDIFLLDYDRNTKKLYSKENIFCLC